MDCSPPSSPVCGISQTRVLEWVAIFSSRGSSEYREKIHYLLHWQADSLPLGSPSLICKEYACNAGDLGFIPGLGRYPGEGSDKNDNPLQYPCLGIPMDRGAWWATVHGVTESDATERLTIYFNFKFIVQ